MSPKEQTFWNKILVPVLAANIISIVGGMGFAVKQYYLFLNTVKVVENLEIIQRAQQSEIQNLKIIDANHSARIGNLERKW
jgi:hypothetical protein